MPTNPPGYMKEYSKVNWTCNTCNKTVRLMNRHKHVKSKRHNKFVQLKRERDDKIAEERLQNGIYSKKKTKENKF